MKHTSVVLAVVALASSGAALASTTIACRINQETGNVEATTPWRNALGVTRADQICVASKPAQPVAPATPQQAHTAVQAAAQIPTREPAPPIQQSAPQVVYQPVPVYIQVPSHAAPQAPMPPAAAAPQAQVATVPVAPQPIAYAPQPMPQPQPSNLNGPVFEVSPTDVNFRRVLSKWAKAAGWTFALEHWAVGKDIPVGGTDIIGGDFKTAVRRLLDSTLLNDTPVQPCFYTNKVLRVIPATELCARSEH